MVKWIKKQDTDTSQIYETYTCSGLFLFQFVLHKKEKIVVFQTKFNCETAKPTVSVTLSMKELKFIYKHAKEYFKEDKGEIQ